MADNRIRASVPDDVRAAARALADSRGWNDSQLVENALLALLAAQGAQPAAPPPGEQAAAVARLAGELEATRRQVAMLRAQALAGVTAARPPGKLPARRRRRWWWPFGA